ncbi:MAG: hypothetical protein WC686_03630 [Candidatus Shapirobacteria bacterium]|jgi:hypothetical protein
MRKEHPKLVDPVSPEAALAQAGFLSLLSSVAIPAAQIPVSLALYHHLDNLTPDQSVTFALAILATTTAVGICFEAKTLKETGQSPNPITQATFLKIHNPLVATLAGTIYGLGSSVIFNPADYAALLSGDARFLSCNVAAKCGCGLTYATGAIILIRSHATEKLTNPVQKIANKTKELSERYGVTQALNVLKSNLNFGHLSQALATDAKLMEQLLAAHHASSTF